VATVLVKDGTLKAGTFIKTDGVIAKVKLILDEKDRKVVKAEPSQPVLVLGFKKTPAVGALVISAEKRGKWQPSAFISQLKPAQPNGETQEGQEGQKEPEDQEEQEKIKIILKADTSATLQALEANLSEEIKLILTGVGQISESDVLLAQATQAKIIGFNVLTPVKVSKLAEQEKINIKTYNVIYKLLEDLEKKVLQMMEPTINETVLGEAEVIAEFKIKGHHIAGCALKKGRINKKDKIHLRREDKILKDAKIKSLQQEKQEINQAEAGTQVGIVFTPDIDFQIGDAIIAYSNKS
jgi:translation initiation factor IF-2